MRLLILTPQFPYPPHQGTSIRNYNLTRELAVRHEIHLLSFVEGPGKVEVEPMRAHCAAICAVAVPRRTTLDRARDTLLSPLPDMALRLESKAMHHQLDQLLRRTSYDVVQIEGIEMGPYLLQISNLTHPPGPRHSRGAWPLLSGPGRDARAAGRLHIPNRRKPLLVFDDHNSEYMLQRRAFETDVRQPERWIEALYSLIQWKKLARYERWCCQAADRVTVVSEMDRRALERLVPGMQATVVSNGVDVAAYDPRAVEHIDPGSAAIVFTGKMDFRPNVDGVLWFARQVLPLVLGEIPDAHFWIVGQRPHERLEALRGNPAVTVTGFVPQIQPYIGGAAVYVVPLRMGGGSRLKILEAMALAKAVVSTSLGCEGFPLMRAGEHLLVADDAVAFAQGVVALLADPSWRRALGQRARDLVTRRYDWAVMTPHLEAVYSAWSAEHHDSTSHEGVTFG